MAVSKEKEQAFEAWDLRTGTAILTRPLGAPITCIAIAPDGARIATGSTEPDQSRPGNSVGVVRLWDLARGTLIHRWDSHRFNFGGSVATVTFSPDGGLLISTGIDRAVAYRPDSDTPLWTVRQEPTQAASSLDALPSFSPDGQWVSLGNSSSPPLICAADTGKVKRHPRRPRGQGRQHDRGRSLALAHPGLPLRPRIRPNRPGRGGVGRVGRAPRSALGSLRPRLRSGTPHRALSGSPSLIGERTAGGHPVRRRGGTDFARNQNDLPQGGWRSIWLPMDDASRSAAPTAR